VASRTILIAVCDGLKGIPGAFNTAWEQAVVQCSASIYLLPQ